MKRRRFFFKFSKSFKHFLEFFRVFNRDGFNFCPVAMFFKKKIVCNGEIALLATTKFMTLYKTFSVTLCTPPPPPKKKKKKKMHHSHLWQPSTTSKNSGRAYLACTFRRIGSHLNLHNRSSTKYERKLARLTSQYRDIFSNISEDTALQNIRTRKVEL